jgi:geranylgeranyl diphosphate synthase, type II
MPSEFVSQFDRFALASLKKLSQELPDVKVLWESLEYSLSSGGKRFRPYLANLVVTAYEKPSDSCLAFALAVEMIHTYSLIHDDLPCMDNDDMRRGRPTNHKVFGEDIALLAGDALLTQAFFLLATEYPIQPELVRILASKAGAVGMIGGQVLDMKSQPQMTLQQLELMHRLKTGALIEAAVLGAAEIAKATSDEKRAWQSFSESIGLAFQIKDDILDATDKDQDHKSFVSLLGLDKTNAALQAQADLSLEALQELNHLQIQPLKDLVIFNQNRNS